MSVLSKASSVLYVKLNLSFVDEEKFLLIDIVFLKNDENITYLFHFYIKDKVLGGEAHFIHEKGETG